MVNPTKIAIWSEIFRKPGITAKELIEILKFKKTKMYYNLKEMLDAELIEAEIVTVKESLNLKKYRISSDFGKILQNREYIMERPREFRLFQIFTIIALLQVEVRKVLDSTNEDLFAEIRKARKEDQLLRGINVLFYSMDREQQLLSDFRDFLESKIANKLRDTIDSEVYEKTFGSFFFGFIGPD